VLKLLLAIKGSQNYDFNSPENFKDVQEIADQLEDFKSRAFGPNGLQIQLQQLKIR